MRKFSCLGMCGFLPVLLCLLVSCGLPEPVPVLNPPVVTPRIAGVDEYEISGGENSDVAYYGIEFYYKLYAGQPIDTLQTTFLNDYNVIANTTTTANLTNNLQQRSFRRISRREISNEILGTNLTPETKPLIPIPNSDFVEWEIVLKNLVLPEQSTLNLTADWFAFPDTSVLLYRTVQSSVTGTESKRFSTDDIDFSADNDLPPGTTSDQEVYAGVIVFVYALDIDSGFQNLYSQTARTDLVRLE